MPIRRMPSLETTLQTDNPKLRNLKYGDFLMWAFADPCNDALKGIFAEWLVLRLLGIPSDRRILWANSDIITPSGLRIEVKSTSYWQDWKLCKEDGTDIADFSQHSIQPDSRVRFAGLIAGDSTGTNPREKGYKSSVYVFCFQREKDPARWNALDLSQWEFYMMTVEQLTEHGAGSISLKKLKELQAGPLSGDELVSRFESVSLEWAATRKTLGLNLFPCSNDKRDDLSRIGMSED